MNESVNYKSNLEHTETNDCNIYQYFPSNGSTFKCGTDNFIEIPMTPLRNSFLVPKSTYLNLSWQATATSTNAATELYDLYSTKAGSNAIIEKLEIYNGSSLLECIEFYNRSYSTMQSLQTNPFQTGGNSSARDSAISDNWGNPSVGASVSGVRMTTAKALSFTAADVNLQTASLSLELSDLLGSSAEKMLPLSMSQPYRIRIYLTPSIEKIFYGIDRSNAATANSNINATYTSGTCTVKEVSLTTKVVQYSDDVYDKMLEAVKSKDNMLKFSGTQIKPCNVNMTYNSNVESIVPNAQWANLKGVVFSPYFPTLSKKGDNYCNFANGLYQAQILVDGRPYPDNIPIGLGDAQHPARSVSQLIMSAINCTTTANKISSANTQLYLSSVNNDGLTTAGTGLPDFPYGVTNCNLGNTEIPADTAITNDAFNWYPLSGAIANMVVQPAGKSAPFFSYGVKLGNVEKGKVTQGISTLGKQVVLSVKQSNTITEPIQPITLAIQQVGATYVVDIARGTIKSFLQ